MTVVPRNRKYELGSVSMFLITEKYITWSQVSWFRITCKTTANLGSEPRFQVTENCLVHPGVGSRLIISKKSDLRGQYPGFLSLPVGSAYWCYLTLRTKTCGQYTYRFLIKRCMLRWACTYPSSGALTRGLLIRGHNNSKQDQILFAKIRKYVPGTRYTYQVFFLSVT